MKVKPKRLRGAPQAPFATARSCHNECVCQMNACECACPHDTPWGVRSGPCLPGISSSAPACSCRRVCSTNLSAGPVRLRRNGGPAHAGGRGCRRRHRTAGRRSDQWHRPQASAHTFAGPLCGGPCGSRLPSLDFTGAAAVRAVTVLGAAIFTPQAAATAGLLVPVQKRAGAIAFIFIGWSAASVAGIPLGSYLASTLSWRSWSSPAWAWPAPLPHCLGAWLPCPTAFSCSLSPLPPGSRPSPPLRLLIVLLVTLLLHVGADDDLFLHRAHPARRLCSGGPEQVALAFAVSGVLPVSQAMPLRPAPWPSRHRPGHCHHHLLPDCGAWHFRRKLRPLCFRTLVGVALWGLGSFSSNSLQQSRLVAIAPNLAAATVALNTSIVYVGQAVGAGLGGWFRLKSNHAVHGLDGVCLDGCGPCRIACCGEGDAALITCRACPVRLPVPARRRRDRPPGRSRRPGRSALLRPC